MGKTMSNLSIADVKMLEKVRAVTTLDILVKITTFTYALAS